MAADFKMFSGTCRSWDAAGSSAGGWMERVGGPVAKKSRRGEVVVGMTLERPNRRIWAQGFLAGSRV